MSGGYKGRINHYENLEPLEREVADNVQWFLFYRSAVWHRQNINIYGTYRATDIEVVLWKALVKYFKEAKENRSSAVEIENRIIHNERKRIKEILEDLNQQYALDQNTLIIVLEAINNSQIFGRATK